MFHSKDIEKNLFAENNIYHICNKSISHYNIFHDDYIASRFLAVAEYYNSSEYKIAYSQLEKYGRTFSPTGLLSQAVGQIIRVIAYCIMPDHYHLLVKPLISSNRAIYLYIGKIENSFSRYFNLNKHRKGPLWQSRFRSVLIKTNEQLLHVSRYIHLNPVTEGLVAKPEDWQNSSYMDYLNQNTLKTLKEISIINSQTYRQFVENNKDYQKTLKRIKSRLLE